MMTTRWFALLKLKSCDTRDQNLPHSELVLRQQRAAFAIEMYGRTGVRMLGHAKTKADALTILEDQKALIDHERDGGVAWVEERDEQDAFSDVRHWDLEKSPLHQPL